jgi:hypothetical protein
MKSKILKIFVAAGVLLLVFSGGFYAGFYLNDIDILCPEKPVPMTLSVDLQSEEGIKIPRGTIIPLYECEYADRFELKFFIPNLQEEANLFTPYKASTETEIEAIQKGAVFQYHLFTKLNGE